MNHRLSFVRLGMAVAICMAAIALALPAAAATLCVGSGGSGCFATIGAAVAAAAPGDTIQVYQGVYAEDVVIGKSLALVGKNPANTIIDATGLANGIVIDGLNHPGLSGIAVSGFTIRNANFEGILITNASKVSIIGNHITANDQGLNYAAGTCPGLPAFETSEALDCGEGIHLSGVDHSLIARNDDEGNSGGMLISDETGPTHDNWILNNLVKNNIYDCGITMPSHPRAPAYQPGAPFGVYSNTVMGNASIGNGTAGGGAGVGMFGFLPGARVSDNTVSGNILIGNGIPGFSMHAHSPFENMSNNTITGNYISGNGADTADAATPGPTGINIYANVIGPSAVTGMVITKNVIKNESVDVAIKTAATVEVHWNNLNGNGTGVANLATVGTVDATSNWWGCDMGPGSSGCSSAMGPNVLVDPALSEPAVPNGRFGDDDQHDQH